MAKPLDKTVTNVFPISAVGKRSVFEGVRYNPRYIDHAAYYRNALFQYLAIHCDTPGILECFWFDPHKVMNAYANLYGIGIVACNDEPAAVVGRPVVDSETGDVAIVLVAGTFTLYISSTKTRYFVDGVEVDDTVYMTGATMRLGLVPILCVISRICEEHEALMDDTNANDSVETHYLN